VVERLRALGFSERDAQTLHDHFAEAEARSKKGHGFSRIDWLATLPDLDPTAHPRREVHEQEYERWDGNGALGYLTLAAIVETTLMNRPRYARVIVARRTFPTGMLGYWTRKLADGGLVAALTATSPRRLAPLRGGPKLTGTNPLAIAIPSTDGRPVVADVSMGKVTYGEVLAGLAEEKDLVPFGGRSAHKAFALAVGLQLVVEALAGDDFGAVLVVARPEHDPVPAFRALAEGVRLPGD